MQIGRHPLPAEQHDAEERRLFYVAVTRAREELTLTSAADHGGVAPRKVSQFVFEALDLSPGAVRARQRSPVPVPGRASSEPHARATQHP